MCLLHITALSDIVALRMTASLPPSISVIFFVDIFKSIPLERCCFLKDFSINHNVLHVCESRSR